MKARSTIDASVDDMAFQEDIDDNPPTLSMVDLKEDDTMVESTELIDVDLEEADSEQDEYES